MDSRLVQNQVHENDEHYPHIDASQQVTHGAEQNFDHEKKSVLNKVKAKAKKIKDTIKKHGNQVLDRGHENNNEDQTTPDSHDLDEDEKIAEDPLNNETPNGESEDVKTATPTSEQVQNLGKSGIDFGGTTTGEEQPRHGANNDEFVFPKPSEVGSGEKDDTKDRKLDYQHGSSAVHESEDVRTAAPTSEHLINLGKIGTDFGGTTGTTFMGEEPSHGAALGGISSTTEQSEIDRNNATEADKTFSVEEKAELPKDNSERSIGLGEEPHTPESRPETFTPPSYQTKVTDPSGVGKDEIEEITPVEESFMKMNVQDEPKYTPEPNIQPTTVDSEYPHTGNHDQFAPHLSDATQTQNPSAEIHDQFNQENISTDISRNLENPTETGQTFNTISTPVEEKPLYEVNTDKDVSPEVEEKPLYEVNTDKDVSPEVEEKPLYEVNTDRDVSPEVEEKPLHEVNTDKAVSPENVRASEVGLGEKDDIKEKVTEINEEQQKSGDASDMSGSTAQNGKSIANSVTEKLAPVYEKVAGVGSAMKSKVTGTGNVDVGTETKNGVKEQDRGVKDDIKDKVAEKNEEQQKSGDASDMSGSTAQNGKNIANSVTEKLAPVYEKVAGVGSAMKSKVTGTGTVDVRTETKNGVKEQDKGVSVKDYLAEKLKPGEEDKALSEVISEALNKPKEDAVKKDDRNLDGGDEKMSEESSVNSPGKGVVSKLKGVVGSWFGKSEEKGHEDLSKNTNSGAEVEQINQVVGEKSSPIEEQGTR